MRRHVAPHRWARATGAERAKLDRHAASCAKCAGERDRVLAVRGELAEIKQRPAPELGWDTIRARVHWAVSSERRATERGGRRGAFVIGALGLAAATAVGGGIFAIHTYVNRAPARVADVAPPAPAPRSAPVWAPAPAPAAVVGLVDRISGDVTIDGAHSTDADVFARHIVAGDTVATGDGRVDIQFGDASAFALGPHSELALRRFDGEAIELAIARGTVDITVAPRAKGQRFVVRAASGREVEVRGTQFRVVEDRGQTRVACRHGLVAVRDAAGGQVEVAGARGVTIAERAAVGAVQPAALASDELAALVAATPYALPFWAGADVLGQATAPLALGGAAHRDVRVDGIEHGVAPVRVRVMPGRHTVEAADAAGRFRRVGWVDVALGGTAIPHLDIPAERAPDPGLRKSQFDTRRDAKRLAACMRRVAKTGLTDTFVQVEIAVDTTGAINMLNIRDTDLPATTANCIHDVLADVNFGAGPSATWTQRIDL